MSVQGLESVIAAVLSSRKYRTVCVDTIRRIAGRELENHGNPRVAIKATKRRLHQVYGAFEGDVDYAAALERLKEAYGCSSVARDAGIKTTCREILGLHASTRERLPILDRFYASIFEHTGQPRSILDLGCGLNPLALPWMELPPGSRYVALDIDSDRVRFLNDYLELAGMEPQARCQDILVHPPDDIADVALLLKTSPSLERQVAGITGGLIEQLRTPFVVVSYSVKSLGGREKGMLDHYRRQFLGVARERGWTTEAQIFDTELVVVVDNSPKNAARRRAVQMPVRGHRATAR